MERTRHWSAVYAYSITHSQMIVKITPVLTTTLRLSCLRPSVLYLDAETCL